MPSNALRALLRLVIGTVAGNVARYASSDFAEHAFCPKCGSHLWMRDTKEPDGSYDLVPGPFDAARDWPLRSEIYHDRAFGAVRLAGEHRRATSRPTPTRRPAPTDPETTSATENFPDSGALVRAEGTDNHVRS